MLVDLLLIPLILLMIGFMHLSKMRAPGGDAVVGFAWSIILNCVALVACLALFASVFAWQQPFPWLNGLSLPQPLLILFGFVVVSIVTVAGAMFCIEWHRGDFPEYLRWFARARITVWLPLLLVFPALWLMHRNDPSVTELTIVKYSQLIALSIALLFCVGLIYGYLRATQARTAAMLEERRKDALRHHQEHLDRIAKQTPEDSIVNILCFTGRYHDPEVRNAAIAKVKSHANWEDEMIKILNESSFSSEVYSFIDGNLVDHPERFIEPIKQSLRNHADEIKRRIKDATNLQPWHMEHFSLIAAYAPLTNSSRKCPAPIFVLRSARFSMRCDRGALNALLTCTSQPPTWSMPG